MKPHRIVGPIEVDVRKLEEVYHTERYIFSEEHASYLPLFTTLCSANSYSSTLSQRLRYNAGKNSVKFAETVTKFFPFATKLPELSTSGTFKELVSSFREQIEEYINTPILLYKEKGWSRTDTYDIYNEAVLRRNTYRASRMRSTGNMFISYWFTALDDTKRILFAAVVKKEFIKLVKLCLILNKEIPPEIIELWVDEDFKKDYKAFYNNFRKQILPKVPPGMEIVPKKNIFSKLCISFTPPKLNTVDELNNWKRTIMLAAVQQAKANMQFNFSNVSDCNY